MPQNQTLTQKKDIESFKKEFRNKHGVTLYIFTPTDASVDWTLTTTTRAASQMIEKITQNDDIETTSVITSLSVFSQ